MLTGNREFDEIYKELKDLVLKTAYIFSGNNYAAAEDITQETFFKLYIEFDILKDGNVKAWLLTTAKHTGINYRKKHSREVSDKFLENAFENHITMEERYVEKERTQEKKALHDKILVTLKEKNTRWYNAVIYTYYMGIPQARVAEIMGMNIRVLQAILHRAREWIKKTYRAEYDEMNR